MGPVCRSIKTLRPPYVERVETADVDAAALQYVRKIAGMRAPSARNREAFDTAVFAVAEATSALLAGIDVRQVAAPAPDGGVSDPLPGRTATASAPNL